MGSFPLRPLLLAVLALAGCAAPRVVLYPDARYQARSQETVQKDIAQCQDLAKQYVQAHKGQLVAKRTGAGGVLGAFFGLIVGAFSGDYGRAVGEGAALGAAAGLAGGAIEAGSPDEVHRRFVEYCLIDRGYKPVGWK